MNTFGGSFVMFWGGICFGAHTESVLIDVGSVLQFLLFVGSNFALMQDTCCLALPTWLWQVIDYLIIVNIPLTEWLPNST